MPPSEAAEAELRTALGIADITFGVTPRVAVASNFQRPLRFNDKVEVDLRVDSVGRSSITYALVVTGPQGVAAEGRIAACLVEQQGSVRPWPPELRGPLTTGGLQESWREDDPGPSE